MELTVLGTRGSIPIGRADSVLFGGQTSCYMLRAGEETVFLDGGSGLIKRCPQCNRSVLGEECSLHGRIEPVMDLRLKLTIDDGTGAISAIINRKDTESLTGITLDMAIDMAKEKGDMSVVADRMSSALLLKKVTVTGNVMSDEYGPQMSVRGTELATTDVQKEAEELYSIVEGSL